MAPHKPLARIFVRSTPLTEDNPHVAGFEDLLNAALTVAH